MRFQGLEIRPFSQVTALRPVRIDRLRVEVRRNCVAGYAKRHAEGTTIILLLRKCSAPSESWHTVEIDPETLRCKQCYGHGNTRRTSEAATFMEAYLAHLQAVRPDRRRGRKQRRAA